MNHSELSYQFQYREYAEALYSALKDDAFYVTIQRSVAGSVEGREAVLKYLDFSICEGAKYGELYCPRDTKYGLSIWSKPLESEFESCKKKEKSEFLRKHISIRYEQKYRQITQFMSRQANLVVNTDAWYLSIVGVLPRFQNRGLGVELIERVIEKADSSGVSTYLETFTPRNEKFYARLGYRVIGSYLEPTIGAPYSLMVRGENNNVA